MEIKNTTAATASATIANVRNETRMSNAAATTAAASHASVTTTSKSSEMKMIESVASASAPFDAKKVAELKKLVDTGNYKIIPGDVADGLILSAQDMVNTMISMMKNAPANQ